MKKKTILILLGISLVVAVGGSVLDVIRAVDLVWLVRVTKDLPIPEAVKSWIWGWR